jgi:hypothetical protein
LRSFLDTDECELALLGFLAIRVLVEILGTARQYV